MLAILDANRGASGTGMVTNVREASGAITPLV
jgi:hypothetical protein